MGAHLEGNPPIPRRAENACDGAQEHGQESGQGFRQHPNVPVHRRHRLGAHVRPPPPKDAASTARTSACTTEAPRVRQLLEVQYSSRHILNFSSVCALLSRSK